VGGRGEAEMLAALGEPDRLAQVARRDVELPLPDVDACLRPPGASELVWVARLLGEPESLPEQLARLARVARVEKGVGEEGGEAERRGAVARRARVVEAALERRERALGLAEVGVGATEPVR
jgi:hypothetical protein